jgi:hypothetical protein
MGVNMWRKARTVLLTAAILAAFTACSERPQRVVSEGEGSYNQEPGNPLAERALHQGESGRIGY